MAAPVSPRSLLVSIVLSLGVSAASWGSVGLALTRWGPSCSHRVFPGFQTLPWEAGRWDMGRCTRGCSAVYMGVSVRTYAGCVHVRGSESGTIALSLEPFSACTFLLGGGHPGTSPPFPGHPTLCPGPGGWLRVCVGQCHWLGDGFIHEKPPVHSGLLHLASSPC